MQQVTPIPPSESTRLEFGLLHATATSGQVQEIQEQERQGPASQSGPLRVLSARGEHIDVTKATSRRPRLRQFDDRHIADIRKRLQQQGVGQAALKDWRDVSYWLVPQGRGQYISWFTMLVTCLMVAVYCCMAGQYRLELLMAGGPGIPLDLKAALAAPENAPGPRGLQRWCWLNEGEDYTFDAAFLLKWGGRYGPALKGAGWWRLLASLFAHQNAQHLLANLLLLATLGTHLEHNYASWRVLLVWLISGVGGSITSAAFESGCLLVVGASGAVFGLMGLFVADLVLNFESISRPILRCLLVVLFTVFFVATVGAGGADSHVSHYSHIGGLLCGLFPSFLFLPNVQDKRWRAAKQLAHAVGFKNRPAGPRDEVRDADVDGGENPASEEDRQSREVLARVERERSFWSRFLVHPFAVVGLLVMLLVFGALPIYLAVAKLPHLQCQDDGVG